MKENIHIPASNNAISQEVGSVLYFIGIGGIGMSAIARYFNSKGVQVSGYDRTETELTKQLEKEGIAIHYQENTELIPKDVSMVVYTPAIPANNKELQFYQQNNYNVVKRSDILKIITENSFNVCVAGTHGKTTVSTMIAHILRHTGFGCNAFLGGISANYGTNFWSSEKNVCVIEADEYDRSFLKLSPNVAVITATDPDHLDIYGTAAEFEKAFVDFSQKVKPGGLLLIKDGLEMETKSKEKNQKQKVEDKYQVESSKYQDEQQKTQQQITPNPKPQTETYSLNNEESNIHTANIKVENGSYVFDVVASDWKLDDVTLHMGGLHNIENVTAAIAVAKYVGIDNEKIKEAVSDFKGVKRRFEYILKNEKHVLIDDYAHHPEELKALIGGVRSLFQQKMTIVFQPHLFSRTKDQADGFASVLSMADEVILLPIYPARELPMEGVSSEMIVERMTNKSAKVLSKDELNEWVKNNRPELLVMAGAGDIDVMVQRVKTILLEV